MIGYLVVSYASLVILFIIGYPLSRYFWGNTGSLGDRGAVDFRVFVSSPVLGFFLYVLVLYFWSTLFEVGIRRVASPLLFAILGAMLLWMIFQKASFGLSLKTLSENRRLIGFLLLVAFPISTFHQIYPLAKQAWLMWYAIGNDGARYLAMIEYLQDHYWIFGQIAKAPLEYPMANRPLMHYAMAATYSVFPMSQYLSYTVASSLVSFLSSLSLAALSSSILPERNRNALLVLSSVVFGAFGFFGVLHYAGYLGQYYSMVPFLMVPCYWFIEKKTLKRLVFLLFMFVITAGMYSAGNVLISVCMLILMAVFYLAARKISFGEFGILLAMIASASGVALFLFNYELLKADASGFLASRNPGFDYGLVKSLLVFSGLVSKYDSFEILQHYSVLVSIFFVCLLFICAYSAIRHFKNQPGFVGMLSTVLGLVSYLVISKNPYLLNKSSIYVLPILMIGLFDFLSAKVPRRPIVRVISLTAALIFLTFAVRGYEVLAYGMDIATSRYTFVNKEFLDAKQRISERYRPKAIFASDYGLERSLLMRQLFKEVEWQPNRAKTVWEEYGYSPSRYPASFDSYNYDLLFMAQDDVDPVDYSVNDSFVVYKNPFFSIYNKGASVVDFGLEWDEIPDGTFEREGIRIHRHYKRTDHESAVLYFVNNGKHRGLRINFEHFDSTGANAVVMPSFELNGRELDAKCAPSGGDRAYDAFIDCKTHGDVRVNKVELIQGAGESTVIHNVTIE